MLFAQLLFNHGTKNKSRFSCDYCDKTESKKVSHVDSYLFAAFGSSHLNRGTKRDFKFEFFRGTNPTKLRIT